MTALSDLQQENLLLKQIKDFLIYFKSFRGISNREIAEKLHYEENYLTRVRNGSVDGGEKLLHALESFYLLDNLQQVAAKENEIRALQREIDTLRTATVEKFYADRRAQTAQPAETSARFGLNERSQRSDARKEARATAANLDAELLKIVSGPMNQSAPPKKPGSPTRRTLAAKTVADKK